MYFICISPLSWILPNLWDFWLFFLVTSAFPKGKRKKLAQRGVRRRRRAGGGSFLMDPNFKAVTPPQIEKWQNSSDPGSSPIQVLARTIVAWPTTTHEIWCIHPAKAPLLGRAAQNCHFHLPFHFQFRGSDTAPPFVRGCVIWASEFFPLSSAPMALNALLHWLLRLLNHTILQT